MTPAKPPFLALIALLIAALGAGFAQTLPAQTLTPVERWSGRPVDRLNLPARLLAAHNGERRAVGVPTLTWNDRLALDAQRWARELALTRSFRHSTPASRPGQGENLFMGTVGAYSPEEMIGYFIGERKIFKPGIFPDVARNGRWADVGHYSQLIWPQTREVGCAIVAAAGQDYLVCRYSPPGNVVGRRVG